MLSDLHAVLRGYPGPLPVLAPLQDIPAFLARPQARVSQAGKAALAAAYQRLTAELDPAAEQQVLHGDAGAGNLMATDRGWVWHDFEDTCSGPVAWDLAASTASRYQDGPRVLAAYRDPVDQHQLAVCEQLRWLHLTVWYNLYAERLPELAPRAAELLAGWATIPPVKLNHLASQTFCTKETRCRRDSAGPGRRPIPSEDTVKGRIECGIY